uniref:heterogeneous nuclear ribonucleoprotein D-like n=1 Tax=Ciona intestinalis TaxID=7719 RepID=UPI00052156EE|nr:heterogeneous nuclear ribonucleoprotein D-like [Ciona intestinalis]|eukprot:XP_002122562.3 heterogeneous nuclear ribonucleoprotein D-like [Ciona intestinalis]
MHENDSNGDSYHDRDIHRRNDAEEAVLDGSLIKQTSNDEKGKMFVGGLSWDTDEFKLKEYFEQFGQVRDCIIKRELETGRSRGFGFILFADASSVQKVVDAKSHLLDGRNIDPKKAKALRKDSKLFVGGLNPDTTQETIQAHFEKFGEVDSIERPVDRNTGKHRGFCFITFCKDGVIHDIIDNNRYQTIDGRQCECKDGDPKKQNKGNQMNNYGGYGQQGWGGGGWGGYGYAGGYYDAGSSGYGGYGGYSGGYDTGYGGYGGYGGYAPQPYSGAGYGDSSQMQGAAGVAGMTGGKSKTGGRGGQNTYKPY